jgi:peptidoglycan/LPS O-acetylase OafA/YrhL
MGWIGVDLFFVLSGFLVSGLLFQEYRQNRRVLIGRFLLRRAFKIYPPFYLMLSVTLLGASLNQYPIDGWRYICEALFIQNYFEGLWNHTWSLAVEEHFYLLLSAVVFLLVRKANKVEDPFSFLPIFILVIGVQILVMRLSFGAYYPVGDWLQILPFTHFRIDSLFFGVLLSYYFHFHHDRLGKIVRDFHGSISSLVIVAVFISLYFKLDASRIPYTIGFTVLYLGFGGLLLLTLFRAKIKTVVYSR